MKSTRLCIGALIYTLISVLPSASGAIIRNPYGECPPIPPFRGLDCWDQPLGRCQDDRECYGNDKCCYDGCGMKCMNVFSGFPNFKPPKPPVWRPDDPIWPPFDPPIPPNFPPKPPMKPLKPPIYYDPINDPILKPYVPPIPINSDDSSEPNLPPILNGPFKPIPYDI